MCSWIAGPACSSDPPQSDAAAPDTGVDEASDEAGNCMPTCTSDANTLVLSFADHPELMNVGGSALVEDPRFQDPVCGQDFVMVAQATAGNYVAVSGSCTHSCCTVSFNKTAQRFDCPCHGSRFNLQGKVILGPAALPLKSLNVCADDCAVYVQLK